MPVNLSIKNTPDDLIHRLRQHASQNHRSLPGKLLAIMEAAVREEPSRTPMALLAEIHRLGLQTPADAASTIRANRDHR
jgi:hypothetical protein